ncbi:MAG TPA: aminotransferase class V-fold PLP-dependent enzyme, partial [Vicinamibacteria bacterium]
FNGHPRFFGYITSSAAPLGMLGDLLSSAVNANVGAWTLSPVATEIEAQTVRWIAELVGFPEGGSGLLVSGGNVANLVAFLAARAARAGFDVRRAGIRGDDTSLRVYASEETHTWLQKAADLAGLGTDAIRWIGTDDALRMDVGRLRREMEDDRSRGERPLLVVGTAGSVSTGAVDPLPDIASLCREMGVWFHVDGAYGGFAVGVPGADPALRGLAEADSLAVDPHKWLYAPLEAGCVLVRDPAALTGAFSYQPPYYHFGEEALNFFELGLQNSRGFRALKVWLQLQQAGRDGYARMIADDIALARELFRRAAEHPELQVFTQSLSISTFRFVPRDQRGGLGDRRVEDRLDELNRRLLARLERSGEAFVSNAVIRGRFALRACIVNFRTSSDDVRILPDIVARMGREVDAEMRTEGL